MASAKPIRGEAPAPVTVRLDPEDAGRLSKTLLDLLDNEAAAASVAPAGFDERATLTLVCAQLRRQLRQL